MILLAASKHGQVCWPQPQGGTLPASRPARQPACRHSRHRSTSVDPALTDTETSRPAPTENHLLINAYTTHPSSPLLAVSRRIADSGCNLVDTRLSTVGRDVSVTALATGSWDAVADRKSTRLNSSHVRTSYAV